MQISDAPNVSNLVKKGLIEKTAGENLANLVNQEKLPNWFRNSIKDLIQKEEWEEINDRFFKNITFGTGGIRGRTISKLVTLPEQGKSDRNCPEFACVGTNTLNELVIMKATIALYQFTKEKITNEGKLNPPSLGIAYDVRHFSQKFSEIISKTWNKLGGNALIFDGPRSTPQLSFIVRLRSLDAGVVVTASHNPFHDNGFKAYSSDGSQIAGIDAQNVIEKYNQLTWEYVCNVWNQREGEFENKFFPKQDDISYLQEIEESVLNLELIKSNSPKIVFTPIHGTGAISSVPAFWEIGADIKVFDEQNDFDPNFSSVKSPNPENENALSKAINFAQKSKCDVVVGTDPDCDRVGLAVRNKDKFECLTGNQTAAILAEYRFYELKRKKILTSENSNRFCLLKTFVTTNLLTHISEKYGAACVNTPTGFKWMAKKLKSYEDKAVNAIYDAEGISLNYNKTDLFTRIEILSRYSKYAVLCAEESYGYLPLDTIRDKDGNASSLAILEALSFIKSINMTPFEFLNEIYTRYGYHYEKTQNIYLDGASGSVKTNKIMESFQKDPPKNIGPFGVKKIIDFSKPELFDEDGEEIPSENFMILELGEGYRAAIRPSGTEPKIKFYIFGEEGVGTKSLSSVKTNVSVCVNEISEALSEEAHRRAN